MSQTDNFISVGILVAWLVGFTIWVIALRLKRRPANDYVLAIAITVIGLYCSYSLYGVSAAFRPSEASLQANCQSNLMRIGLGLLAYSEDNDKHFPPANQWATAIKPYTSFQGKTGLYHCPKAQSPYSYAFNKSLNFLPQQGELESRCLVMTFESNAKTINASGSSTDLCPPRHEGKSNYGFADGHVQSFGKAAPYTIYGTSALNWNPAPVEHRSRIRKKMHAK